MYLDSYDYVENVNESIDLAIFKATSKIDTLIQNRTDSINRRHTVEWNKKNKILSSEIKKEFNTNRKTNSGDEIFILNLTNKLYVDFAKPLIKNTKKDVESIYKNNKTQFTQTHEITPIKKIDTDIIPIFTNADEIIMSGLTDNHQLATNAFYKGNLSKEVSQIVNKTFKEGGNFKETGIKLEKRLLKLLGLKKSKIDLKITQTGYNGSIDSYFKGLGETTLNRSRSFSSLRSIADAQISAYIIAAIIDKRTSDICVSMNGRTFKTKEGLQHIDNVVNVKSLDELKSAAPWRRDLSEFGVTERKKMVNNKKLSSKLALAGLALPPYHFLCRTTIQPV